MKRVPFVVRRPMKIKDLRQPIFISDESWYQIPGFEGIYEMNISGFIRRFGNHEYLTQYPCKNGDSIVIMHHPDGDGSALCCSVSDLWTTTFYGDNALFEYGYMDNIKRKTKQID